MGAVADPYTKNLIASNNISLLYYPISNQDPLEWNYNTQIFHEGNCSQLLENLIQYGTQMVDLTNLVTQCNIYGQIECCKGNENIGPQVCGSFWGPNAIDGTCDQIMLDYCTENSGDPKCDCLTSPLPQPQCSDPNCRNYGFKNSTMLDALNNGKCTGQYLTCQQLVSLSPSAIDNVLNNINMTQYCAQELSNGTGNNNSSNNIGLINVGLFLNSNTMLIIIIIVIVIFAFLIGIGLYFLLFKKSKSQPLTTTEQTKINQELKNKIDYLMKEVKKNK